MKDIRLRPSDAHRWMNCAGAIQYQKELGIIDEPSVFALEGSLCHSVAEKLLRGDKLPKDVDKEIVEYAEDYAAYVKSLGGTQLYEVKVSFNEYIPNGSGTCDAIVIQDDTLNVIDLKYGVGVTISAYKNPQLMLYALGAYLLYDMVYSFSKIKLVVHQPRLDHISEYTFSVDELLNFGEEVKIKAKAAFSDDPILTAGADQCRFCPCKVKCEALVKFTQTTLSLRQHDGGVQDSDLKHIIESKPFIINWLNAVEESAKLRLLNHEEIEGLKLIEGAGRRKWYDESAAEYQLQSILGEKAYSKKLLSVAQAEKALSKEDRPIIGNLAYKGAGAPKLVVDSAKGKTFSDTWLGFEVIED